MTPTDTAELLETITNLERSLAGGVVEDVCSEFRCAFHLIYDLAIVHGAAAIPHKDRIIAVYDKSTQMPFDEGTAPHMEMIRKRAEWIHLLFEKGDRAVHEAIRRELAKSR